MSTHSMEAKNKKKIHPKLDEQNIEQFRMELIWCYGVNQQTQILLNRI